MTSVKTDGDIEMPLEALLLSQSKDRYKYSYAAIRWAKEIKLKENLPDPLRNLVPRALRELLTGKVTLKQVEALPVKIKMAPAPPPAPAPTALNLNVEAAPASSAPEEQTPKE